MYKNYIFDLYGTLVDINTNEHKHSLWKNMAMIYSMSGANYTPAELKKTYYRFLDEEIKSLPKEKYSTNPEPQIDNVFRRMYTAKGELTALLCCFIDLCSKIVDVFHLAR